MLNVSHKPNVSVKMEPSKERLGMLPGPTFVPDSVMESMKDSNIYHRSEEFHELFDEIQDGLKYVFGTSRTVFVLTSSGTGGLESIVDNYLRAGDKVLVIINGYFSNELSSILEAFHIHCSRLEVDWHKGVSADLLENALKKDQKLKS